jgi:hypothetical protein
MSYRLDRRVVAAAVSPQVDHQPFGVGSFERIEHVLGELLDRPCLGVAHPIERDVDRALLFHECHGVVGHLVAVFGGCGLEAVGGEPQSLQ